MVQQAEAQVDHAGHQIDLPRRMVAAMDGPARQSVGGALRVIKQFMGATGENRGGSVARRTRACGL